MSTYLSQLCAYYIDQKLNSDKISLTYEEKVPVLTFQANLPVEGNTMPLTVMTWNGNNNNQCKLIHVTGDSILMPLL